MRRILRGSIQSLSVVDKLETPKLNSGDTVVSLGSLSITVAMLCGAINSGLVSWELEKPWWVLVLAVAAGGAMGKLIGRALARMLYSSPPDRVAVVKAGPAALPKTLVASLLGAIAATALLGFAPAAVLGGLVLVMSITLISAASAVVVGILWGILAALV